MSDTPRRFCIVDALANTARGGLIGLAELVPGVSGGTIALITGVYERVLAAGDQIISAAKRLVVGPERFKGCLAHLKRVEWWLVLPLLLGMAVAVLSMAGAMAGFVEGSPTLARGLFLGMVAASVAVPLLLINRSELHRKHWPIYAGLFAGAALAAWLLTSSGAGQVVANPSYLVVFAAAAVAVCALVLPGVSGSFFLLVVGLYAPTLHAVHERNLGYIAVFALGALTGIVLFIRALNWLLKNHHTGVMFAMSGLLLGSLRALWPWQVEGALAAPGADVAPVVGLAVLGALIVGGLVLADRLLSRTAERAAEEATA